MSPMSGTTAMEKPKLKATRSALPRAFFLGKRAAINVYPGKNSMKGKPRIIRKTLEAKKVTIIMSRIAKTFMSRSSFLSLILMAQQNLGQVERNNYTIYRY
ncbi:unnamed protein product [marine sediment metagenome]|uniref:Uncharacterized protein n=1 Tax=marine sediment metagenome TaxID=412755 RepID=X1NBK5_9ZZZZ